MRIRPRGSKLSFKFLSRSYLVLSKQVQLSALILELEKLAGYEAYIIALGEFIYQFNGGLNAVCAAGAREEP